MKILYLTLKAKYYDMIESGFKTEEYRDIKPFWIKRLVECVDYELGFGKLNATVRFKDFTHVTFARGGHFHPSIPQITLELNGIEIGLGLPKWGAELDKEYFVIKLGEKISTNNSRASTQLLNK